MFKTILLSLCLIVSLVALTGCRAGVETEKGHGAAVGVG